MNFLSYFDRSEVQRRIVTRTEQIWIKPNKPLSSLCHLSKNLYNEGNYQLRQELFKNFSIYIFNEYIKRFLQEGLSKESPNDLSCGMNFESNGNDKFLRKDFDALSLYYN